MVSGLPPSSSPELGGGGLYVRASTSSRLNWLAGSPVHGSLCVWYCPISACPGFDLVSAVDDQLQFSEESFAKELLLDHDSKVYDLSTVEHHR